MARSTASTAILPAKAGAWAFQVEISPLRDCRVAVVVCRPWPTDWKIVSTSNPSRVPMPAAAEGPRWATWSILCLCRQMALTRFTWIS
ncbi:hypothetical protein PJL15_03496 [Paenarthrobacter nitroguajacolicus]|nr:hypothetical protein [Paenarthrobacter nitroguajacolicus]